jgi:hypothetical protein
MLKNISTTCFRSFSSVPVLVPKTQGDRWRILSGFSTFSSRKDVERLLLESNSKYQVIDAMLSKHDYLAGKWAVLFDSAGDIQALEARLKKGSSPRKLEYMSDTYLQFQFASDKNITNKTVRLKDILSEIRLDDLLYFFEDYGVTSADISCTYSKHRSSHYYINFRNSELAQACVSEKNLAFLNDRPVHMFWYDV